MATEIRIPRSKKDLRIRHNKAIQNNLLDNPTLEEKAAFLCDLTGTALYEIRKLSSKNIEKLYQTAVLSFSGFKLNDSPPDTITLDGKKYDLVDPFKVASGWHIDFSNIDVEKDPVRMACMYYFPKGERYGETDENGNIINPASSRYETFQEHFPLQLYLECRAFFLSKLAKSTKQQLAVRRGQKLGMKMNRFLRGINGKKQLTHLQKNSPTENGTK